VKDTKVRGERSLEEREIDRKEKLRGGYKVEWCVNV
jgi:hypothetical protein